MKRDLSSIYKEKREHHKSTEGENYIKHGLRVRRIDNFYQESEVHDFKVQSDEHAEPWGGGNRAPSPLEYLLSAIGFSINNQIVIQSAVNRVKLGSLETVATVSFDSKGCLDIKGHDPSIAKVFLEFKIASDSPPGKVRKVLEKASICDPIYQTLRKVAKIEKKLYLVSETKAGRIANHRGAESR